MEPKSIDRIFWDAAQIASPSEREAYLAQACACDVEMRGRIEQLLQARSKAESFLESPAPALTTTVDEPITERPGTVIGPYKLLEEIGEGGFGLVFMAEQQQPIRRKVAVKVLKPGMDTRQVIARFEAERQALALMDHPNIAKVLEGGETASGRPYFVMDLVKGVPIAEYCDQNTLTTRARLELFVSVCQAVQHAHQKGIIHRDIKPSNVLVTMQDGAPLVKVIDFGIAKALGQQLTDKTLFTGFAQMIGTPLYMSPEQAALSNVDVDTRSDIYSLGVLLYELLTGTTPFDKDKLKEASYDEMRRIIREEEPPKPSTRISTLGQAATTVSAQRQSDPKHLSELFRGELDWIVMKALEKDRNRRYETASAFAADVQRYLHDESVTACPPSAWYRFRKFARRNKTGLAIAGLILFCIMFLGGGIGWVVRDRAARQAESTRQIQDLLTAARGLLADNQVGRARQKLAEARSRIGENRTVVGSLADEVEALDAELGKFERFLELVEQAHEAEFPQPVMLALQADRNGGKTAVPQAASGPDRDPAKAVPFLLEALSCYGVLEQEDWSARLEGGLLGPDQMARVRRTAYEELLWLADDVGRRGADHRSGRRISPQEAAQEGLAYLAKAESGLRPTSAFYQIRARCGKAQGQERQARQDAELARQTPGTIALDHYMLGLAAFDARNKTEAVQEFEAALRAEATHYWSLLLLGNSLRKLGQREQDFVEAKAAFTGCILKRPGHAQAYLGRGEAYWKLKRFKQAEEDFREAVRLRPEYPEAHNNLGVALADQGKFAEAVAEYREALRLRPEYPSPHYNLGTDLYRERKLAEAEAEYREAIRLRPDYPEAHCALGAALLDQGKHAEGEVQCREALRLLPDLPEAHVNLGNALNAQGKHAQAEAECREALRLRPEDPEGHTNLGDALRAQGKLVEAVAQDREALRLRPDWPTAHNGLGLSLLRLGKGAEAIEQFWKALVAEPSYTPVLWNLALLLAYGPDPKLRDPRRAIGLAKKGIELIPRLTGPWGQEEWWGILGCAYYRNGDWKASLAALEKSIELEKDRADQPPPVIPSAYHWLFLAMTHWQLGNPKDARQWYDRAVEWIVRNREKPSSDALVADIRSLRAEAAELLGVQPAGGAEHIGLAICQYYNKLYAGASRFYAEAFAAEPKLADDLRTHDRYNAACAAALAGCGQGDDTAKLDEKERARLRRQALDWLRADLTAWGELLEKVPEQARAAVQQILRHWQEDIDFAGVRGNALANLPEAERQPWHQLWADVEKTLRKASQQSTKGTKKPSN